MPPSDPTPVREIDPTVEDVRSLVAARFPDAAGLPVRRATEGWDNLLFRLGETMAVRIPRRAVAVPLAMAEHRWLPALAPHLPLPVPTPLHTDVAGPGVPWVWSIVPWFAGVPTDRQPLATTRAAGQLGGFLRALHRPAPPDAPLNPFRGVPLPEVEARTCNDLRALEGTVDVDRLARVVEQGMHAPLHPGPPLWLHGDPHPGNVLADGQGDLVALVDWGDLTAGDPATDLAAVWMHLPIDLHASFWQAYGLPSDALRARTRAWGVRFGCMLLRIGLGDAEGPQRTYANVGRLTLRRLLAT